MRLLGHAVEDLLLLVVELFVVGQRLLLLLELDCRLGSLHVSMGELPQLTPAGLVHLLARRALPA